jgi:serine/threonine protein kinase
MIKEGIILGERYEIISRVGSGGMADVYKAKDHKLDRLVAVKVLKAEFRQDAAFVAKFRKEAQAAAGLAHPNVVNVFDVGEDRGLYYIVMELVEGITLKDYITKKGKLSVKEATSIAIQVSLGLEAAHNRGIIHRDVKPQNIIISTDGKVKLSDFGIAKATNSNTITANVMGSVHYSSPEQVRGGFSDAKSDIYSLGITMYEMVTGRVPFDGDTTVSIAIKHLQEEMVPPSRYTPDLPYSLEQIILKCTQKNPERRYDNMGQLVEDLKHSLLDPQGNFVVLTPLSAHAQTVRMSDRELEQIRSEGTGRRPSRYEEEDEDEDDYDEEYEDENEEDEDDGVSSKLEKAITIGGFLIGGVIIVILIIVIGNMAGLFNRSSAPADNSASTSVSASVSDSSEDEDLIAVPDLRGRTVEEAKIILNDLKLGIRQTGSEPSDTVPEGQIVSQSKDYGEKVAINTTIEVTVSSGADQVTIPTGLTGAEQDVATDQLTRLGLVTSAQLEASDTVAVGRVTRVVPGEGEKVDPGSTVTLYISSGAAATPTPEPDKTVEVPGLRGLDEATAISSLESRGLRYTIVDGEYTNALHVGDVLSTDPEAGTEVAEGTTITVYVNPEEDSGEEETPSADGTAWVCRSPLAEPQSYNGGNVRLTLEQNGTETTFYDGGNPWANGNYSEPIYGASGVSTGVIHVYEDGVEIATYSSNVVFEAP